ncbi:MAG: DUF2062 domain-containing protein [Acidobacteriota bacterium]
MRPQELRDKIASAIVEQLTQGLSPERIALTVAVGLCIAVIPVVGVTTILTFAAAWALRLNQPIIQTINWSSYALQLLLIFPFIRLGEKMFRAPRMTMSLDQLVAFVKTDPLAALASLGTTIGHAVVAWIVVMPFVGMLIFLASRSLVRALARQVGPARAKEEGGEPPAVV